MKEELFSKFWEDVSDSIGFDAGEVLRDYLPRLKASLKALDVTSVYWSHGPSPWPAQVLLCGSGGFGRMEFERKGSKTPQYEWSHELRLRVLPWSEVTEITQNFIREGDGMEPSVLRLSEAVMSRRSGESIRLLPATDMTNSGGIRALGDKVERYNDLTVFIGAMIEAQFFRTSGTVAA